jgi:hypothetical protein
MKNTRIRQAIMLISITATTVPGCAFFNSFVTIDLLKGKTMYYYSC